MFRCRCTAPTAATALLLGAALLLQAGCHRIFPFDPNTGVLPDGGGFDSPGHGDGSVDGGLPGDAAQPGDGDASLSDAPLVWDTGSTLADAAPPADAPVAPVDAAVQQDAPVVAADAPVVAADAAAQQDAPVAPADAALPADSAQPVADAVTSDAPPPPTGVIWSKVVSTTGQDVVHAAAVDPSGNLYITGLVSGGIDLGGGQLPPLGSFDAFLASYTSSGAHRWSKRMGGSQGDIGLAVAVGQNGGLVAIAGQSSSDPAGFGGPGLDCGAGTGDIVVAAYDAAFGTHLWSKCIGGGAADEGAGVAVDASGNVTITGHFAGPNVAFDPPSGAILSSTANSADIFVASYTASGTHRWSESFGSSGGEWGRGLAVDPAGNLYLAGIFSGVVQFGNDTLNSVGFNGDALLGSLDSAGNPRWAKKLSGSDVYSREEGNGVAATSSQVLVAGFFDGSLDFGAAALTAATAGTDDGFVGSAAAGNGALGWARQLGGPSNVRPKAVAVGPGGNVYVAGDFAGTADLGITVVSAGATDPFIVSVTTNNNVRWVRTLAGVGYGQGYGVAAAADGVYLVGSFYGTLNLGSGAVTTNPANFSDGFVVKFPLQP